MPIEAPTSDLDRCVTHEAANQWPDQIEIVAYWKSKTGRGKRMSVTIKGDEFFGLASGAPMSGDHLIGIIERLRKSGNGK